MVGLRIFFGNILCPCTMKKDLLLFGFDHAICFDVIMTLVFSTMSTLNISVYQNLKTNSFSW